MKVGFYEMKRIVDFMKYLFRYFIIDDSIVKWNWIEYVVFWLLNVMFDVVLI